MLNQPPGTPEVAPAPDGVEDTTSTPSDDAVATEGKTVAEVEAEWRNRVSAKDRGHAAAERALREENERLRAQLAAPSGGTSGTPEGGNPREAELERQLGDERRLRVAAERRAKYPNLVEAGVSDDLFAAGDEASLAKLNAQLDMTGGRIAPTSPRKTGPAAPPKAPEDMSKAELEAAMQRQIAAGAHLPRE